MSPTPDVLVETRSARRLADALLLAANQEATVNHLSDGCVAGALTLLLGRVVGGIARDRRRDFDRLIEFVVGQLRTIGREEFHRSTWPLQ